jgi:hypothetical protein
MASRYDIPDGSHPGVEAEIKGQFELATGEWRIEALAIDEEGKSCRNAWSTEVNAEPMPAPAAQQQVLRHATILVNAAPTHSQFGPMSPSDVSMIGGSLTALLRAFPAHATRLVVFNLEQRTELFRSDQFQAEMLKQVVATVEATQAGAVHYGPPTAEEFLGRLIDEANSEADPRGDLVVFIGPATPEAAHAPRQTAPKGATHPLFAYLQFPGPSSNALPSRLAPTPVRNVNQGPGCGGGDAPCPNPSRPFNPQLRRSPVVVRDPISEAVAGLGGKTVAVGNPEDFAQSLKVLAGLTRAQVITR